MSAGKKTNTVVLEDQTIKMWGVSRESHFDDSNRDSNNWCTIPISSDFDPANDSIADIKTGADFTLFVTESGKLFGIGKKFTKDVLDLEPPENDKPQFVKLPLLCSDEENLDVKRVWTSMANDQ